MKATEIAQGMASADGTNEKEITVSAMQGTNLMSVEDVSMRRTQRHAKERRAGHAQRRVGVNGGMEHVRRSVQDIDHVRNRKKQLKVATKLLL